MKKLGCLAVSLALVAAAGCDSDCDTTPVTTAAGSGGTAGSGGAGGTDGAGGGGSDCTVIIDADVAADRVIAAGCVVQIPENVAIIDDATLTLEAGVRVEMATGVSLDVGDETPGKLIATGTANDPVYFTSGNSTPTTGDWHAVEINATAMSGTAFSHVIFEYGGGNPDDYYPGALHFPNPEEVPTGRVSVEVRTKHLDPDRRLPNLVLELGRVATRSRCARWLGCCRSWTAWRRTHRLGVGPVGSGTVCLLGLVSSCVGAEGALASPPQWWPPASGPRPARSSWQAV